MMSTLMVEIRPDFGDSIQSTITMEPSVDMGLLLVRGVLENASSMTKLLPTYVGADRNGKCDVGVQVESSWPDDFDLDGQL